MTHTERLTQAGHAKTAHTEEWLSILICLIGTAAATWFIWAAPVYEPESGPAWTIPVWLALTYLLVQLVCLLVSATQIRALGVLNSIVSIVPVVAGAVTVVEWMLGHLQLSSFEMIALLPRSVVSRPLKGEVPTIDLVIGYHKANTSPILRTFLSRIDDLTAQISSKGPRTSGPGSALAPR